MSYSYAYNKQWRLDNRVARNRHRRTYYHKHNYATKETVRIPFSIAECEAILSRRFPDKVLAKKLKRSVLSIQIKRSRLMKIGEETP